MFTIPAFQNLQCHFQFWRQVRGGTKPWNDAPYTHNRFLNSHAFKAIFVHVVISIIRIKLNYIIIKTDFAVFKQPHCSIKLTWYWRLSELTLATFLQILLVQIASLSEFLEFDFAIGQLLSAIESHFAMTHS